MVDDIIFVLNLCDSNVLNVQKIYVENMLYMKLCTEYNKPPHCGRNQTVVSV